jgi:RNA polymerase sigma-70 factor (ECF subfamily)
MTNEPMSTAQLAAEPLDWGLLIERHRRWLATVIRSRISDSTTVDDLLQEVLLAALKQPNRPSEEEKVAPWLYRIAVRKVINHRRHLGRRRKLLDGFVRERGETAGLETSSPGEWLLRKELDGRVSAAMRKLDAGDRQILLLKYTEGWGYRKLAEHLGTTEKTVEYRLLRARQALRDLMNADHEQS